MKVMIVVTHLLGTGHLARALTLARAFQAAGDDVTVVSGGLPVPQLDRGDVNILQLPPVRSNGIDFSILLDEDGHTASIDHLAKRQELLLGAFNDTRPDAIITELYPFGRRILRAEFAALLNAVDAAPKRPIVCASIRDILAPPSKPKKAETAHHIIGAQYDRVLVHSDATLMPLDLSWPVTPALQSKLVYTGFVAPPPPAPHSKMLGSGEILISAGGGNVGLPLFECAVKAAAKLPNAAFRLLVGGAQSQATCETLNINAPSNLTAEPARPDFRQMLNHAAVSISLCGYNTALDILQTGCPAIFLPFDAGNEVEQSIRAQSLARQNGITVLNNAALTPEKLLEAIATVRSAPQRTPLTTGTDGAAQTQRIVRDLVALNQ